MAIADWEDRERAVAEIHTCLANTVTTIILIGSKNSTKALGPTNRAHAAISVLDSHHPPILK